jgi:uncharacterized Zn finger protein
MGYWSYYPPYVSVAQRRARALRQAEKLKKKHPDLEPVTVTGRTIARSWWGKSWCQNLERYADYENRIGRGRSYLWNGMVLDLKIGAGCINGIVAGSAATPYRIAIKIKPLAAPVWKKIVGNAAGRIGSLQTLLAGGFPADLQDLFFSRERGLFPRPAEISLDCSCPDYAVMCKHVAAVLYGVGARLDAKPALFFTLRGVSMEELVGRVAQQATTELLGRKNTASARILSTVGKKSTDMGALFGISLAHADKGIVPVRRKTKPKSRWSDNKINR